MLKFLCPRVFRQQLQELRLKKEQEREQRGGRRRELQGETAGERVKPRRAQTQDPNSNRDQEEQEQEPVKMQHPHGATRGRRTASVL